MFGLLQRRCIWIPPSTGSDSFQALGTAYEQMVANVMVCRMGMSNVITKGGRGDAGIDLTGEWNLGGRNMNIIAQCKRINRKGSPILIREIEGSMLGSGFDLSKTIGLIASTMSPSEATRLRLKKSGLSLLYLRMLEDLVEEVYASNQFMAVFPEFSVSPSRADTRPSMALFFNGTRLGNSS